MYSIISSVLMTLVSLYALVVLIGVGVASLTPGRTWSFKLFGREILHVSGSSAAPLLTSGEEAEEEEEEDERTLEERLGDLDIPTTEAVGAVSLDDIGSVFFDTSAYEEDCPSCEADTLHPFGEVIGNAAPDGEPPTRALRNRYGSACDSCGHLDVNGTFEPRGRFGSLIGGRVELDLFGLLKGLEPKEEEPAVPEDDGALAERERELEGELNGIRLRRQRAALENRTIDPFRGTASAPAGRLSDPPDDRAKAMPALKEAEK